MSSPYTTTLIEGARPNAPRVPGPVIAPAGHPVAFAPAPRYVAAPRPRGSRIESTMMMLLVIVVVAVAAVGGYAMSRAMAPTPYEQQQYQAIAERQGVFNGRIAGYNQGRAQGIAENRQIARYRALIARAQAYNKGWRQGLRMGKRMPRGYGGYGGYYGGYRGYRGYGGGNAAWQTSSALATAQNIANVTGAPVDVEVY